MKVGDLVKLLKDPEVQKNNPHIDPKSVGLVVEINRARAHARGPLTSLWIQWAGMPDWDMMYVEDLTVVTTCK